MNGTAHRSPDSAGSAGRAVAWVPPVLLAWRAPFPQAGAAQPTHPPKDTQQP